MEQSNQLDPQQDGSPTNSKPADRDSQTTESLPSGWFQTSNRNRKGKFVYLSTSARERSFSLKQTIGYGLLLLAVFDYAQILIPPEFTNYAWEMQAIAQMVERVPVPLIGLALVLYRPEAEVDKQELYILRCLSWLSLALGLFYLSTIPLAIHNTQRIYRANNAQIYSILARQLQQLQPLKAQLDRAKTDREIAHLLAAIDRPIFPSIPEESQQIKTQLLTRITQTEQQLQTQAENRRDRQKQALIKNSVKWNLGALVSGILFMRIWRLTRWARTQHRL